LSRVVRAPDTVWAVGQYGVLRLNPATAAWQQLDPPVKLVVPEDDATGAD